MFSSGVGQGNVLKIVESIWGLWKNMAKVAENF